MADTVPFELRKLARLVAKHDRQLSTLGTTPQLAYSSIEDGAVQEFDQEGNLVSIVGKQFDGTHTAASVGGPTPPAPSEPTVSGRTLGLTVTWDGVFRNSYGYIDPTWPAPMDFARVEVHASTDSGFAADTAGTIRATIETARGREVTFFVPAGTWYVRLVVRSQSGKPSTPSQPVSGISAPLGEAPEIVLAQQTADRKITISPDAPTLADGAGKPVPALWQQVVTGTVQGNWAWNGAAWVEMPLDEVLIPQINIGTGTYGILNGIRLEANSVGADRIDVVDLYANTTFTDNLFTKIGVFLTNSDGSGNTSVVDGFGIRSFYTDPETLEVQERVRLGTHPGTDDYLALTDDTGELSVSFDKDGSGAVRTFDVRDTLYLNGTDVTEMFKADGPRGMVAWAQVPITPNMSSNNEVGLFELGWESDQTTPGRMYRFTLYPFLVDATAANGVIGLRARFTTDGSPPEITNGLLGYSYASPPIVGLSTTQQWSRLIGSSNGSYIRVGISLYDTSSGVATVYQGTGQTHLFASVEDIGPMIPHSASATTMGGTPWTGSPVAPPAAPRVTRTQTWEDLGVRSFTGSNATYAYNPSRGYQGLSPAGVGNLKCQWVFPSVTSALSGATINDIWTYVYFEHWYYGSGGTARIRLHGNSSLPATYNGTGFGVNSGAWPRGAGRWVRLSDSLYAGFQSGTYKGFGLEGDSTLATYGIANNAALRIRYTK